MVKWFQKISRRLKDWLLLTPESRDRLDANIRKVYGDAYVDKKLKEQREKENR